MGLIIVSVILAVCSVVLTIHVWQGTPFFDMNLVFVDVVLFLVVAVLLATVMMSPTDKQRSLS